ncbi:MAG: hypothetical protein AB7I30_04195 [Isosphaeraceae bacterium]
MRPTTRIMTLRLGLGLCVLSMAGTNRAQTGGFLGQRPAASVPPSPASPSQNQALDAKLVPAAGGIPDLTPADQLKPANIAVPDVPIEPFLLTKDHGPFMVLAKTFRGPEAEKFALALTLELRNVYGLPAYILRTKDFPQRSNMRGIPPTAPPHLRRAELSEPEKFRTHDEAAVLVGNEKSLADSEKLLKKVRAIKPDCIEQMPKIFGWREGLKSASRTTNPFVPTQNLFPGRKKDALVEQMNGGPRSIFHCPGRYTLQVAEFSGRSIYNPAQKDMRAFDNDWLRKSPLATAADDAERLADAIARDPEVQRSGFQPYVYHDRTSSRVMIGSFNSPSDPNAVKLRDTMVKLAVPIADRNKGTVIAPANALTDLEDPTRPIKVR